MAKQVVVLGTPDKKTDASVVRFKELAAESGNDVEVVFVDSTQSADEVVAQCQDAVAIIPAGVRALTTEMMSKLPNLQLVQTTSAGTDWIDKPAVYELGVKVANNGGGNRVAVAEHTITLMVAAYRRLEHQIRTARAGKWLGEAVMPGEAEDYHTLEEKTVGIVGLGRIGQAVAKRLRGWDCEIVYYDVIDFENEITEQLNATKLPFDELLAVSDVVTLHVPLEPTTKGMMSTREFGLMKKTAMLINACRGPVVDEAALIEALRAGEIAGAGLDVLEQEPTPVDNPLFEMDNVIITPHLASRAIESMYTSTEFAIANVSRVARGEEPTSVVLPI
ncbi:MAG: lactate dehydrogenase [Chloroflexi bacterium]|nr:lactate dehydrogenase [Chloroflexota bacterium]